MKEAIHPFQDPSLPVPQRVRDLVSRMSLREKVGQLNQVFCGWNAYRVVDGQVEFTPQFLASLREGMSGAVYGMHRTGATDAGRERSVNPTEGTRAVNLAQKLAIEHSRWGIPLLVSEECPKGYCAPGATVFSSPLAYGSSWNRDLLSRIGRVIAAEVRAGGGHAGYAPILDICHDPRWGRMEESYGEDPFLSGELGAAMVRGLQDRAPGGSGGVISTLKHFVAYGTTEGGRNTAPAHLGPRELRQMHLPAFAKAVAAGAGSVMCSYNEIDGVPVAGDPVVLTDILRGEMGFEGFVVSDAISIDELHQGNAENIKHCVAETIEDAAALALNAGVDLSLWDRAFRSLEAAVSSGKVTLEVLDRAVSRVLAAKFRLGLFENPFVDEDAAERIMGAPAHQALSLEAARQSLVLLKNSGPTLPLRRGCRIGVIGPNAHSVANQLGTYTPSAADLRSGSSIFEGLRDLGGGPELVRFARGCRIKDPSRAGFDEAMEVAQWADVVVAVMGGSSTHDGPIEVNAAGQADPLSAVSTSDVDCGEGIDRADLKLSGVQEDLLRQLRSTGKPVVLVLNQGRPHELTEFEPWVQAILCAWYPGPHGGQAVAEILFGEAAPSGKLTVSFPKCVGQIPVNYNHKPTAQKRYLGLDTKPLYPFGHGLTYTSFAYSNLRLDRSEIPVHGTLNASVDVSNTGTRRGTEVVQLYLRDEFASVTQPIRQLCGFERVELEPGQTCTVSFRIGPEDLALWNAHLQRVVEPGWFTVYAGGDSIAPLSARFRVAAGA